MTSMDDFKPPPIFPAPLSELFTTEHLLVRRIVEADLDSLRPTLEDPDVATWFGRDKPVDPQAAVDSAIAQWEAQVAWNFTIIETESQHVVGYTGISLEPREGGAGGWQVEPAIAVAPDYRRQQYATEAMRGLVGWSFTDLECPTGITMDEVRAACLPDNEKSIGLLRKLADSGMKDHGEQAVTVKHPGPGEPQTRIARVFSVTREDYEQKDHGASPR